MFFSFSSRFFLLCILTFSISANLVFADTLNKEATFYADSLEWNLTKNGDIFHNNWYSAALCDLPLDTYIYASWWWTGVVVDINDRPASSTCSQKPDIIDFSKEVFRLFAPPSVGRISNIQVTPLWVAPTDVEKWFLSSDVFAHLGVRLTSQVPTVLFAGEGMTIRGKVLEKSKYAIISLSESGLDSKESSLVKVEKDWTFQIQILLPKTPGKYTFVIAKGQGFNTEKFATIALVNKKNLFYPSLPTERYKIIPRITTSPGVPSIVLPDNLSADITLRQWDSIFQTSGKSLILSDTGLKVWRANIQISGDLLSTSSPLDRRAHVNTLFSGSVILDRTHEITGKDRVSIQTKWNIANFRFKTPNDISLKDKYYITSPDGEVQEIDFSNQYKIQNKFLKKSISIKEILPITQKWVYKLEVVQADWRAFINTVLINWLYWPIINPISDLDRSTISSDKNIVVTQIYNRINELRSSLWREELRLNPDLNRVAQEKVNDMIKRNYEWHEDPDGVYIDSLANKLKVNYSSIGENIWVWETSHFSLQDGLEESGIHRKSMLDKDYTGIGIGYGIKKGRVYLVQVFTK
jgi:hypothetical protein